MPRLLTRARMQWWTALGSVTLLVLLAGLLPRASAVVPPGHRHAMLLFTRQLCDSLSAPCWEIVVSDAHENHARVVAGPYPRSVWDDHFIANWAPDGRSAIFMADFGHGQAIWQVRTDGTHLHAVFSAPDGTFMDDGPAFTPDGRHIVFTRCCAPEVETGYALWSVTSHGRHLRPVTSERVPAGIDGPSDNLPQVSPSGREVTFTRNVVDPSGGALGSRVSIAPLPAGESTDITDPTALDPGIPNWTPDGRQIAFQNPVADGSIDIWRVNRDGTGLTRLTDDGVSLNPSYTRDGRLLLTRIDDEGGRDIYLARSDGSDPRRIKATDDIERFPHLIEPSRGVGHGARHH